VAASHECEHATHVLLRRLHLRATVCTTTRRTAGGVGQAIASPTDVVKVRLQADGRLKALGKEPR
jgi:hypothetical protein